MRWNLCVNSGPEQYRVTTDRVKRCTVQVAEREYEAAEVPILDPDGFYTAEFEDGGGLIRVNREWVVAMYPREGSE